jgi:hypothetical protein
MISSTLAVDTLITVNKGVYTERVYSTTSRTFKPSYDTKPAGFIHDKELFNKVLATYVSHEWINK